MRRQRLLLRLFAAYVLVLLPTAVGMGWLASRRATHEAERRIDEQLLQAAWSLEEIARPLLPSTGSAQLQRTVRRLGRRTGIRLTVLDARGQPLADSIEDPRQLGDHLDRPEIQRAAKAGIGRSRRFSTTTLEQRMYVARAVQGPDDEVLGYVRSSLPLTAITDRLAAVRQAIATGAAVATLAGLLLALLVARRVTRPIREMTTTAEAIAAGRYDRRVEVARHDEIGRLAEAFNRMTDQVRERISSLDRERSRLEAILASMVEGVVAVDEEERVLHLNRAAARLLGVDTEAARGRRIWELARNPAITAALEEVFTVGEDAASTRTAVQTGDRLLELHAAPIRGGGAVLVFDDLTELKRLETVRRDFVANVSHELKTPVTAIVGLIETLLGERPPAPEQQRRFLERIGEQSQRLTELVRDLLTLSRLEGPAPTSRAADVVDLTAITEESLRAHRPHADARGIRLDAALPPAPLRLRGDPESLRQAVDNLLANAIRYTERGGRVTVRLGSRDGGVELEVEDTGVGIETRHLDRIFERFYRVDTARSREVGGTGLGLAIVKHVALSHGGRIDVESEPRRGSIFRLSLPSSVR